MVYAQDILDDYDALLSTDTNFMLGRWQAWARSWADTNADEIRNNLEYNARNQLTLWGPTGQINDYVCRLLTSQSHSFPATGHSKRIDLAGKEGVGWSCALLLQEEVPASVLHGYRRPRQGLRVGPT
jgi:hypothetical protein